MAAKGQGWHGDSSGHSAAAKGQKAKQASTTSGTGRGWHGDPQGHAIAAKGQESKSKNQEYIEKLAEDTD